MRDLFKILDKLIDKRVPFTFQTEVADNYHNLCVNDPKKKRHFISKVNLDDVEKEVVDMWGHLLDKKMPSPRMTMVPMPLPPIDML